jgi:hydrogenase maturation protease
MRLVLGYGNTLRGDDGLGPTLVERLAGAGLPDDVEWLALRQLTPELAEPISRADTVIFIDCRVGAVPGQIDCQALAPDPAPRMAPSSAFTHEAQPAGLLNSAGALYGRAPAAYLYSVTGESYAFGAGFSPAVEAAIPALLAMITDRLTLA